MALEKCRERWSARVLLDRTFVATCPLGSSQSGCWQVEEVARDFGLLWPLCIITYEAVHNNQCALRITEEDIAPLMRDESLHDRRTTLHAEHVRLEESVVLIVSSPM